VLVVFIRSVYSTERNIYLSDCWLEQAARKQSGGYTRFPVCVEGSWEGDYYGAVRPQPGDPVVTRHRYNAFLNTDLDTILRANVIRTVVLPASPRMSASEPPRVRPSCATTMP